MADHINDLLNHLTTLQKQCLPGSDAVPYFIHVQEGYPYWVNVIQGVTIDTDGEDFDVRVYNVLMRLYVGGITSGLRGELERRAYAFAARVEGMFNRRGGSLRPYLESGVYPDGLTEIGAVGARLTGWSMEVLPAGGVGSGASASTVLALNFELEIAMHISIEEEPDGIVQ